MSRIPFIAIVLAACSSSSGPAPAPAPVMPAEFSARLTRLGDSVVGMGCLPAGRDSMEFKLAIILETPTPVDGGFAISLRERPAPASNISYPNVSVSLYPFGTGRVSGNACGKTEVAVFRTSLTALWKSTIILDPPGSVLIEVYTSAGRTMLSKRVTRPPAEQTIMWTAPPSF